ncbi:MAG: PAS domain S-box protein [Methylococcales bacterium]
MSAEQIKTNQGAIPASEDSLHLLHELQTHQVQLEMQIQKVRQTQMELDSMRLSYFELYDLAPLGYCTLSSDGVIVEANFTSAILLGLDRNLLIQQPLHRFIFNEDQDIYYLFRKQLNSAKEAQACELRIVKKDGALLWINLVASLIKDTEGNALIRVVINNITDRIVSEQNANRLRDQNSKYSEQYHNMLATTGDGFLLVSKTGRIEDVNEKFIQFCGYSREELLTMTIGDLEVQESRQQIHDHIAQVIKVKHDLFETQHQSKTGLLIDLEVSVTYQESTGQFLSFFRDIGERKKILQQETQARIEAQASLKRALSAERNLLKVWEETHRRIGQDLHDDVGQQITGIAFLFEVLRKDLLKMGNSFAADTQKITTRLNQVVTRVRELSHGLCPVAADCNNLIALLKSLADETAGIYGVTCNFHYDAEHLGHGFFDYTDIHKEELNIQLFRIAQEAITNAIKHGRATQIGLFLKHAPSGDVLEITDNGIGISKEHTHSGLGMFSMASRAQMLNADISFIDMEMGGMCVCLCLPNDVVSTTSNTCG